MRKTATRLLAYSSVSHLGFVVVGLFALNYQGLQGSLLTMINLGFSTAGLFFIAGFLYSRQQTTQLSAFGGMAKQVPLLATFFLIIGLASIGLPGTNGFVGEFLILLGAFQAQWWFGAVAVLGDKRLMFLFTAPSAPGQYTLEATLLKRKASPVSSLRDFKVP